MLRYYNCDNISSVNSIAKHLNPIWKEALTNKKDIIILCIGSDRSTGDSLGPFVGYMLNGLNIKHVYIYGDLHSPVHASNLAKTLQQINNKHKNAFILAIDASLGSTNHIGYITVSSGPLKPGLGVKKQLPEVGNMHITGIVNSSSSCNFNSLQNTRLSTIVKLSDVIALAILNSLISLDTHLFDQ